MRYSILDFIRWISVLGMIFFHANYLLEYIFQKDTIPLTDGFWNVLWYLVVTTFIFLAGFVSVLSLQRNSIDEIIQKTLKRIGMLSLLALSVTIVTYLYIPEARISWGILHFLALASLIGILTVRSWYLAFFLGILVFAFPYFLSLDIGSFFLIPIGFPPRDYFSADYYPLFPWFGYYLVGQGMWYMCKKFQLLIYLDWNISKNNFFTFLGRHALIIYMIHVPILYGVFLLLWK